MKKRSRMSRGKSKRSFTKHAMHVNHRNAGRSVMRGGIRL